jgi:hypothetical protein
MKERDAQKTSVSWSRMVTKDVGSNWVLLKACSDQWFAVASKMATEFGFLESALIK